MIGGPLFCSASADDVGATASATAAVTAVSFDVFLRSAVRSSIERTLMIGGGADTRYALTNHGMRLVWGQIADIDGGSDTERPGEAPIDGIGAKRRSAVHGD